MSVISNKMVNGLENIPGAEKEKEWFRLWKPIILKLQNYPDESALLKVLASDNGVRDWKTLKHLTEYGLANASNFPTIFSRISSEINNTSSGGDTRINTMLAEMRCIPLLRQLGFTEIVYARQNSLDFKCLLNGNPYEIEITYIGGSDFKTQGTPIELKPDQPLYRLRSGGLVNRLKSKYQEKEKQIKTKIIKGRPVIIIVTDLFETHPSWLEHDQFEGKHPIQAFVDAYEIPTIVFACGTNLFFSDKLLNIALDFDRDRYLKMAYGIDVAQSDNESYLCS